MGTLFRFPFHGLAAAVVVDHRFHPIVPDYSVSGNGFANKISSENAYLYNDLMG